MNPLGDTNPNLPPSNPLPASLPTTPPHPHDPKTSSPPVIHTGRSSAPVFRHFSTSSWTSSLGDGGQRSLHLPSSGVPQRSQSLSSAFQPGLRSPPTSSLTSDPAPLTPPPYRLSLICSSPDLRPSPLVEPPPPAPPDMECSICFSQFNNVFRCPKVLSCRHTFCLECLARINVKSPEPDSIQCPLCRGLTPLPSLGLPKLATNSSVLSCLPAAMQRVYSVRFVRNKGKLQVKRSSEGPRQWGRRSDNFSLHVGLPSPPAVAPAREGDGVGGALFRLTGRPACRAFLLTSLVLMMVLLMGIIVFLLIYNRENKMP